MFASHEHNTLSRKIQCIVDNLLILHYFMVYEDDKRTTNFIQRSTMVILYWF
jgi:hypothetical protein